MGLLSFIDVVVKIRNLHVLSLMFYFEGTSDMLLDHDESGWAMS